MLVQLISIDFHKICKRVVNILEFKCKTYNSNSNITIRQSFNFTSMEECLCMHTHLRKYLYLCIFCNENPTNLSIKSPNLVGSPGMNWCKDSTSILANVSWRVLDGHKMRKEQSIWFKHFYTLIDCVQKGKSCIIITMIESGVKINFFLKK